MKKILTILSMAILAQASAIAQQNATITGRVTDKDGKPLFAINVGLKDTSFGTLTNKNGDFTIGNVPAGIYTLVATAVNYEGQQKSGDLIRGGTVTIDFSLTEKLIKLKEVNITATGLTKSTQDIPGAISVIDSKSITESGAQNIGEIITRAPGVNFQDEDGRGLKPNIGLRGLNPSRNRDVMVLVDGKFPVGMTLYGDNAGYYFMPIQQVDRVEIIKGGAASVLYGGYSVGGVVNLISKKSGYKAETRADITYGSWNGLVAQATSGRDTGKFGYFINAVRQGDSFRKNGKFAVNDITAKFDVRPDDSSEISVYLNAFSEDSETPGGISQAQFESDLTQSNNPNDHFYSKRFSTAITYSKTLNPFNGLNLSVYGNYFERNWFIAVTSPVRKGYVRDIHNTGIIADYKWTKGLFGLKNSLIIGTRIHTSRLDDVGIAQKTGNFSSQTGTITKSAVNTGFSYGFYAYDELQLTENLIFPPE